jgi:PAS domain S-box-containing protein
VHTPVSSLAEPVPLPAAGPHGRTRLALRSIAEGLLITLGLLALFTLNHPDHPAAPDHLHSGLEITIQKLAALTAGIATAAWRWTHRTARLKLRAQILASEQTTAQYRLLLDNARDHAICLLDADGFVITWNDGARRIKGFTAEQALGRHISTFYPPDATLAGEPWNMLRIAATEGVARVERPRVRADGSSYWAQVSLTALRDPAGKLTGYAKVVRDVSEQHEARELLLRHRDDLAEANLRLEAQAIELGTRAAQLDLARTAAESAARAKSAFLDNISHEIRSPMAAILGYAELLKSHDTPPAEHAAAIDALHRTGQHLLAIINDLLDASKIEAGRLSVDLAPCSPADVLRDVRTIAAQFAHSKALDLNFALLSPIPASIHSDPLRLRQILLNLVNNAIKFTDRGSVTIHARWNQASSSLDFTVQDTGIGIDPASIDQLFQPFVQTDTSSSRRFGGTGLGLSISRSLARLLGGELTVQSQPNAGSTFTLSIPTGTLPDHNTIASLDDQPSTSPIPTNHAPRPLAGLHILLADDSPDLRRLIATQLRNAGAQVTTASNGDEAIHLATNTHPLSLVLMDMQMPGTDGLSATKHLRSKGFATPIIALTANNNDSADLCHRAGCSAFVGKPISRQDLITTCLRFTQPATPTRRAA